MDKPIIPPLMDGLRRVNPVTVLMANQVGKARFGALPALCWRVSLGAVPRVAGLGRVLRLMRGRARLRIAAVGGGAVQGGDSDETIKRNSSK
jgi:hypothetical protein